MKREVAERLRSVCEQMSASEFDQLVERIVTVKIKYTMRRTEDLFLEARAKGGISDI